MDTSDDPVTALVIAGGIGAGVAASQSGLFGGSPSIPSIEADTTKSIQAGTSDAEKRRRMLFTQMSKYRKATLLAKRDQPEPLLKATKLGAGT